MQRPIEAFTVGHSTHPIERFLDLVRAHRIEAIADVRRYPGSRRNPQFGADALASSLAVAAIEYAPFGDELGGRRAARPDSVNSAWNVAAFRGYADHMSSAQFAAGLARLESLAARRRTAVMCAEGHWSRCHRRLIADALVARGLRVTHILPDSRSEEHRLTPFAVVHGGLPTYPGQGSLLG
jgi:uncharacterized protein (DUF488 family)